MSHPAESTLDADTPEPQPPFPVRPVFIAAFLPALLGLSCGLFILRPMMGFDPFVGLLSWLNFTEGGTWNTIATPDPNNIAQTIEVPLTWWPPGQYLFLGLLNSCGLSWGGAALVIAFISTISGAVGLATLARDLGASSNSLVWISGSYACSIYSLVNFHQFEGGEPLIMALWPWAELVAWRLRNRNVLLVCVLPLLFLVGSFIKHSFAVYSLCILAFLGLDRLSKLKGLRKDKPLEVIRRLVAISAPLVVSGVLYIALRHYTIDTSGTPEVGASYYTYNIQEIWSQVPNSPLLSALEIRSAPLRSWSKLLNIDLELLSNTLTLLLSVLTPISTLAYLFLTLRKSPLARFSGITSIVTVIVYLSLHSLDYAISLEDRHFKQAGSLLIATIAAESVKKRRFAVLARIIVIAAMTWGIVRFVHLTYIGKRPSSIIYLSDNGLSSSLDRSLLEELRSSLSQLEGNSIFLLAQPDLGLTLRPFRPDSVRLMPIFDHGFYLADSYRGKVPQIVMAHPNSWEVTEDELKALFKDYDKEEWYSYTIADWTFLQTRPPPSRAQP